jgi:chitodextrinase
VGFSSYAVESCAGSGCSNFAPLNNTAATTYTDSGLAANTSYAYRVRAIDTAGTPGGYSSVSSATTLSPQPPTAPTNLSASAVSGTQVNLSWTASTSSVGLANYVVQRCQNTGCTNFAQIATPAGTAYSDASVTSGNTYSYQVQAVDTAGSSSAFSNVATATAQSGLAAAFAFGEGSGTTLFDSSSSGTTGIVKGASWTSSGKYGNALSFDGVSNYVDLGRPSALISTGSMTWEAWVYPATVPADDGQIIALSNDAAGWQFKTTPDTGPRTFGLAVSPDSSSHIQLYGKTTVALNTWYHVAGVYDAAARTLHIYVNGVLDDGALLGTVPAAQVLPTGVNVNIGRRGGASGFYLGGTIDEVRIYTRALSQSEIQTDMTTPIAESAPIAALSPSSLDFGAQVIDTTSDPRVVTLINNGSTNLAINGVTITGTGASSYSQTNTCGLAVAPGASCTISIRFAPTSSGSQVATVSIADNAPGNPHTVPLTGVGAAGLSISPRSAALNAILTQQFTANASGVTWSVDGIVGGTTASGTISTTGLYTPPAPAASGTHVIMGSSGTQTANATVYITNWAGTLTRDISTMRTGLNDSETVLSPANVNPSQFGKRFTYSIDGTADASPLYVPNVNIPGQGAHNVVYLATEHDSVYAFDADARQSSPLWQVSFINPANGITTVPPNDTGECCDISPEIGITGSPVIDPSTNTLYVVAKTKEVVAGATNYFHRLHSLDIATGAEKFGGPVVIQASVPGTGDGSIGGRVAFQSLHQNQRPALLLNKGVVYVGFGAHGDVRPYHGWVIGYNATTLAQSMVYCTSPNDPGTQANGGGSGAGVWQSGDGLATDSTGNIFFVTGNGLFDANTGGSDYGDSFLKIDPLGALLDFFTPHDQQYMNDHDIDLGSGGVLLLPDQPGPHPRLAITAGKNGTIYLVDRDNMGHYNPSNDSQIVQSIVNIFPHGDFTTGNFKAPVYWNGNVYFSADKDNLKAFSLTNGLLSTTPTSISALQPSYPGATLGVSSSGSTSAIVWAIQRVDLDPTGVGVRGPGSLHAFDATNLGTELYNSNQSGSRDTLDYTAKWSSPLIANGKVYVASLSQLTIYGLLP